VETPNLSKMMLIAMSLEPTMVDERRVKSNQAVKVARRSHDDYRRRYGTESFFGDDSNRDDCGRSVNSDERTSAVLEIIKPPVKRNNFGDGDVRNWERSDLVTCDYGEKPGNFDGTVDWTKPQADVNIGTTVDGAADGYHPVRRRLFADCERSETATVVAADDASPEDRRRRQHGTQQWFGNCWLPKPSSAVPDIHQNHHRRVHRHRHHHHHTHHLHMWTSSCCWWLLVFYAVVVVVASFARAAHSAKDGKYITILYYIRTRYWRSKSYQYLVRRGLVCNGPHGKITYIHSVLVTAYPFDELLIANCLWQS